MKTKQTKRTLAWALALCMVLTLLPVMSVPALATGNPTDAATLQTALTNAGGTGTVTVNSAISIPSGTTITVPAGVTLEVTGGTLTIGGSITVNGTMTVSSGTVTVSNNGSGSDGININGTMTVSSGTVTVSNGNSSNTGIMVQATGTLNLSGDASSFIVSGTGNVKGANWHQCNELHHKRRHCCCNWRQSRVNPRLHRTQRV